MSLVLWSQRDIFILQEGRSRMYFDSHAHYDDEAFNEDREAGICCCIRFGKAEWIM